MMTASLILASAIGNGIVHLLCLILFVFFACVMAGLLTMAISGFVAIYIQSKSLEANINHHQRIESSNDEQVSHERTSNTKQTERGGFFPLAFSLTLFTALFFFFLFIVFPTKRCWNELVAPDTTTSQVAHGRYWVTTSSGKTHNSSCRYYANSKGHYSSKGTGNNCKICGGAN